MMIYNATSTTFLEVSFLLRALDFFCSTFELICKLCFQRLRFSKSKPQIITHVFNLKIIFRKKLDELKMLKQS